jgi:nucleotidyltransferase AbiEii toxin of type IV toxin-antitoxin system
MAVDQGSIMQVGRGLYVARGTRPTEHHSLAHASKRVPKGVVCLLSALRFHNLTTQSPFEVWLAIGEKARLPKLANPPLHNRISRIKQLFAGIISQSVEDDGLVFDPTSLRVARIKEEQEYEGLRINFIARLERAKIHMQVDVGFGDIIVPPPEKIEYPRMLDFPAARLMAYPKEAVVEKLEALVKLGIVNTRMKDFYDLWKLSRDFDFDGALLCNAIKATFKRRGTEVPSDTPLALTHEFSGDVQKAKQWQAFVRKSNLDHDAVTLDTVAADLTEFLMSPLHRIGTSRQFAMAWRRGGPWSPATARI